MKFWPSKYNSKIRVSQQELREISTEISLNYSPEIHSDYPELVLLPVDPFHVYAYWSIENGHQITLLDNDSLILRIYWQIEDLINAVDNKHWLDFPVHSSVHQKKLFVPYDNTIYSAAIGNQDDVDGFLIHAFSNVVQTPRCGMRSIQNDTCIVSAESQDNLDCDNNHDLESKKKMKIDLASVEKTGKLEQKPKLDNYIFFQEDSDVFGIEGAVYMEEKKLGSSNYLSCIKR